MTQHMHRTGSLLVSAVSLVLFGGCASNPSKPSTATGGARATLTGTVAYRERIALTPDALVTVRLVGSSPQNATARILAETTFVTGGRQVPIPFVLSYDADKIVPDRTYSLRASIASAGRMIFSTATAYPVITLGHPTQVSMMLEGVGATLPNPQRPALGDTVLWRGTFVYMADAGRFIDCATGSSYPVAKRGANAALEQMYSQQRLALGAPLLVTLRGHLEELPGMEEGRREVHLVVYQVERAWPGATCADRTPP